MVKAKETVAKDSFAYLMALARVRSYNDNGKLLSNFICGMLFYSHNSYVF